MKKDITYDYQSYTITKRYFIQKYVKKQLSQDITTKTTIKHFYRLIFYYKHIIQNWYDLPLKMIAKIPDDPITSLIPKHIIQTLSSIEETESIKQTELSLQTIKHKLLPHHVRYLRNINTKTIEHLSMKYARQISRINKTMQKNERI